MEENNNKNPEVIDLGLIIKKVFKSKKLFLKTLPAAFVLSSLYIICFPRYYSSQIKLAPELENSGAGGAITSIASSFGIDLGEMQTSDAITPLLYPDLLEDNGFIASTYNIKVKSQDGEIETTYFDYLEKHQKAPFWSGFFRWIKKLLPKKESTVSGSKEFDPYYLSERENGIAEIIRDKIQIGIDKQTGVITIDTEAQDPLICKTLADSIKERLQDFITNYRTNKARIDYEYYNKLTIEAKQEYEKARHRYGSMSDANSKVVLRSAELRMQDMENDMQLKYNAYTTLSTQLEAAKAKVQARTPAFTVLKGASVPIRPSGPKRMFFVLGMLILVTFIDIIWIVKDELHF